MKINSIFVDSFKNLSNCEIKPHGLHALTGCNGCGKSNFIQALQTVIKLITGSDQTRSEILRGFSPFSSNVWIPYLNNRKLVKGFTFSIESLCEVKKSNWLINYVLKLEKPIYFDSNPYAVKGSGRILSEEISIKEVGKTGQKRVVLLRESDGLTTLKHELSPRKKSTFYTKEDMTAIQALETREASQFSLNFPVLNQFRNDFISLNFLNIDPAKIVESSYDYMPSLSQYNPTIGDSIDVFPLFQSMKNIQNNDKAWNDFLLWTNRLINIQDIRLTEDEIQSGSDISTGLDSKKKRLKYIFLNQGKSILWPKELSTGELTILSLLTAIYSFSINSSCIIIEEPETYLHPKATIDLIKLFRDLSNSRTVIISTHSPVILNSMQPDEVTLLKRKNSEQMTTTPVNSLKEAINTLNRGFLSFGDLLQTNFNTDNDS